MTDNDDTLSTSIDPVAVKRLLDAATSAARDNAGAVERARLKEALLWFTYTPPVRVIDVEARNRALFAEYKAQEPRQAGDVYARVADAVFGPIDAALTDRILGMLIRTRGQQLDGGEMMKRLPGVELSDVSKALKRLIDEGHIVEGRNAWTNGATMLYSLQPSQADNLRHQLADTEKALAKYQRACDEAFQPGWNGSGSQPILPDFLRAGDDKAEAVVQLAKAYDAQQIEIAGLKVRLRAQQDPRDEKVLIEAATRFLALIARPGVGTTAGHINDAFREVLLILREAAIAKPAVTMDIAHRVLDAYVKHLDATRTTTPSVISLHAALCEVFAVPPDDLAKQVMAHRVVRMRDAILGAVDSLARSHNTLWRLCGSPQNDDSHAFDVALGQLEQEGKLLVTADTNPSRSKLYSLK